MYKFAFLLFLGGEIVAQTVQPDPTSTTTEILKILAILALPTVMVLNAISAWIMQQTKKTGEETKILAEKAIALAKENKETGEHNKALAEQAIKLGEENKTAGKKNETSVAQIKTSVDGHTSLLTEKIAGLENTVKILAKVAGERTDQPAMQTPLTQQSMAEAIKQAVVDQSVSQQVVEKQIVQEVVRENPKKDK